MLLLKKVVIVGLLIYALFFIIESCLVIAYPNQVSYPEGFILNQANLITKGEPIYKDINNYPFIVTNYPPVYLFLCAGLIKIFGLSFAPGRIITFFATICVALIIYKILKREVSYKISLLSALLFIASSYIYKNTPFMRVDMLGLFFSLLGFYIFIKTDDNKNTFYSVPFFILSLYTKQTFVAGPIAVALWLFINQKKRGTIFILLMGISYGIIFFILNLLTSGEFYRHNFLYNLNTFIFKQAIKHYVWFLQNHAVLFLFSLFFVFDKIRQKTPDIFAIYFLIAAFVAFSVGKIGANTNYFFELISLSCILTGLSLERLKKIIEEKTFNLLIQTALIVQLLLSLHMPFLNEPTPTREDWKNFKELSEIISKTDGEMVSEDVGVLILNRKQVLFQPFEFTQLAIQRLWDQERFINDIRNKRFSLIILSFDLNYFVDKERLTPEMVKAIKANYYIEKNIGEYFLYKPIFNK